MLSQEALQKGIDKNNNELDRALKNQLSIIYSRRVPTGNFFRYIVGIPRSASKYLIQYVLISIPENSNLDNFFFVAYNDSGNIKYVSENLRRNQLGAKLDLFTSPNSDKDPSTGGDQKQYLGMLPLFIELKGSEQLIFDFRGTGLATLNFVDVLIYGTQCNRLYSGQQGGNYGDL